MTIRKVTLTTVSGGVLEYNVNSFDDLINQINENEIGRFYCLLYGTFEVYNSLIDIKINNQLEDTYAIVYLSHDLLNDGKSVLYMVKRNGLTLEYASYDLRNDYEIVFEAVKQKGVALEYASDILKDDYDIVFEAVKQNGRALEYASNDLKNNYNIVLEAVKQNRRALAYASDDLKNNNF